MGLSAKEELTRWLDSECIDDDTKAEINRMTEQEKEFAFGSTMSFGTAGLRSIMSPGIACMNKYTVAQATSGLAKYILSQTPSVKEKGVAIAYDSRHHSEEFAIRSAEVLSAYGIPSFVFAGLRPTPMLSFAVRELGCIAGINVTASHNAKEYNGYKVYWEDGAQIGTEQAEAISALILATDICNDLPKKEETVSSLISIIPTSLEEKYQEKVLQQRVNPALIEKASEILDIVYTPLHGTGSTVIPKVLEKAGMKRIHYVEEQMIADGAFPTATYPNPENADVFSLGIGLAEKYGSDLLIATDPDADRVGTMVRSPKGKFVRLTGNQMGVLLLDYICQSLEEQNLMPKDAYVVKSFVSTEMARKVCEVHNVELFDVLTGFKYIGETIKKHEAVGKGTFLLGFEESYGYLKGTYARDKDSVVATLLICEMAAYYALKGMTLFDAMEQCYKKYGFYSEEVFSITFSTGNALEKMKEVMKRIRSDSPSVIGGAKLVSVTDYLSNRKRNQMTGLVEESGLPKADALEYVTENNVKVLIRPSGTEPKIKVYLLGGDASKEQLEEKLKKCKSDVQKMFE